MTGYRSATNYARNLIVCLLASGRPARPWLRPAQSVQDQHQAYSYKINWNTALGALIVYKNILRISQDSLQSTRRAFSISREWKNEQLATCSSFSSGSVCKTIAVDGGWKGVRGGGCGRPALGSLSFSITKSVATTAADRTDGWPMCGGQVTYVKSREISQ